MLIKAVEESTSMLNFWRKMRLMSGEFFAILIQQNQLLIFYKINLMLRIWWICFHLSFCKLQKMMVACISQPGKFYLCMFSI
jgi:hypothetical protein